MNNIIHKFNVFFVTLIVITGISACNNNEPLPAPNILWLTFEDTSPQFIGCYGNEVAHTPNIDKLAAEGVRFTSAFSTGTVCSPSRFTLITGCRTSRFSTGHHRSYYDIPEEIEAFPLYLKQHGYYTSNNSKTDYNTSKQNHFIETGWDESSDEAGWWKRKSGQPFFAVFNSFHSHQSRTMTNPYWKYKEQILQHLDSSEIIDGNDIDLPPIFNDTPEMRKDLSRIYNAIQLTDKQFGEILDRLNKEGLTDSTIIFCFSDHGEGMPWGKTYSRGMGYRVPFVIWFPEMYKHLSPWGTQVITEDIIDFADLPATVLSLAGIKKPEYMDGRAILGDFSETTKTYTIGGLDRTGENTTLCRSISDGKHIYTKNFMPFQAEKRWQKYFDFSDISNHIREDYKAGLLNPVQSYLLENHGSESYFDLENDPWETNNLALPTGARNTNELSDRSANEKSSQHITETEIASEIKEFKEALKEDLIKNRDAHFIPEYCFSQSEKNPYELSRDSIFYPAKEIIEMAFLCGDKDGLQKQLKGLKHDNKVVRYWAAIGVYSHYTLFEFEGTAPALPDDTFLPANVFIQASKAQFSGDEKAKQWLLDALSSYPNEIGVLSAQLLLLQETIEEKQLEKIIASSSASKNGTIRQFGELFEYKFKGKNLEYTKFW